MRALLNCRVLESKVALWSAAFTGPGDIDGAFRSALSVRLTRPPPMSDAEFASVNGLVEGRTFDDHATLMMRRDLWTSPTRYRQTVRQVLEAARLQGEELARQLAALQAERRACRGVIGFRAQAPMRSPRRVRSARAPRPVRRARRSAAHVKPPDPEPPSDSEPATWRWPRIPPLKADFCPVLVDGGRASLCCRLFLIASDVAPHRKPLRRSLRVSACTKAAALAPSAPSWWAWCAVHPIALVLLQSEDVPLAGQTSANSARVQRREPRRKAGPMPGGPCGLRPIAPSQVVGSRSRSMTYSGSLLYCRGSAKGRAVRGNGSSRGPTRTWSRAKGPASGRTE
jgi:hypothetical protein